MAIEIKVVIPSAGRASGITTTKYIDKCILCVPESELTIYRQFNPTTEIITHPDDVKGLGNKRNWIYKEFGNVFMVDDDTKGLNRIYKVKNKKCSPREAYDMIQYAGNIAKMMDCYLFGFNKIPNPLNYKGLKPFPMTGYINGAAIGMLEGSVLKFSDTVTCNNDVYISLLNAFYHRKCFIDSRFCIMQNSIAKNTGGLSNVRTHNAEEKDIELLKQMFGPVIKVVRKQNSAKQYNITLKIPF
jgi:hypothetical protein